MSESFVLPDPVSSPGATPSSVTLLDLVTLPEADRQSALERFRLLQPHLDEGKPLILVAHQANIPYRTAQRWVSLYRRFGLAALARKQRADRGARRSRSPWMHKPGPAAGRLEAGWLRPAL